jgi:pyridoxine/pyridoxamine 5'-phosphate oxidase
MDRTALYEFLARNRYGVVSSIYAEGEPQSALVGIAITSELEIVFDTLNSSRKYANLVARPACSFVVGWEGEKTVQLEGLAREAAGLDLERCQEAYFATWPDGKSRLRWPGIAYFAVKPVWIRYSDYDQDPPCIQEYPIEEFPMRH